jgi:hypothetical protein
LTVKIFGCFEQTMNEPIEINNDVRMKIFDYFV